MSNIPRHREPCQAICWVAHILWQNESWSSGPEIKHSVLGPLELSDLSTKIIIASNLYYWLKAKILSQLAQLVHSLMYGSYYQLSFLKTNETLQDSFSDEWLKSQIVVVDHDCKLGPQFQYLEMSQ